MGIKDYYYIFSSIIITVSHRQSKQILWISACQTSKTHQAPLNAGACFIDAFNLSAVHAIAVLSILLEHLLVIEPEDFSSPNKLNKAENQRCRSVKYQELVKKPFAASGKVSVTIEDTTVVLLWCWGVNVESSLWGPGSSDGDACKDPLAR